MPRLSPGSWMPPVRPPASAKYEAWALVTPPRRLPSTRMVRMLSTPAVSATSRRGRPSQSEAGAVGGGGRVAGEVRETGGMAGSRKGAQPPAKREEPGKGPAHGKGEKSTGEGNVPSEILGDRDRPAGEIAQGESAGEATGEIQVGGSPGDGGVGGGVGAAAGGGAFVGLIDCEGREGGGLHVGSQGVVGGGRSVPPGGAG